MKKILIIDDDETIIDHIRKSFKEFYAEGVYSLLGEVVNSAEDALAMIKKFDCDIILLDHHLSNKGEGLNVAKEIETKENPENPIVLSIGSNIKDLKKEMSLYRENGVCHFPGKSFFSIKKCLALECKCHLL